MTYSRTVTDTYSLSAANVTCVTSCSDVLLWHQNKRDVSFLPSFSSFILVFCSLLPISLTVLSSNRSTIYLCNGFTERVKQLSGLLHSPITFMPHTFYLSWHCTASWVERKKRILTIRRNIQVSMLYYVLNIITIYLSVYYSQVFIINFHS